MQKKNYSTSVDNTDTKNENSILEMQKLGRSYGFMDLNDFPELKQSSKLVRSSSNNSGFTNNNPWLSVVTKGNKNKLNLAVPECSARLKKNAITSNTQENELEQSSSTNKMSDLETSRIGDEKSSYKNLTEGKASLKKSQVQPRRNPNKKKRSEPVFIDLQKILAISKVQKRDKKHDAFKNKVQRRRDKELLSGNLLDSSNPKRSRGKFREIKKKKLSTFKTTIIKERILKTKLRENALDSEFGCKSVNLLNEIDFGVEIKIYCNELNNKKLKNSESKKNKANKEILEKIKDSEEDVQAKLMVSKNKNSQKIGDQKEKRIPQVTAEGEIKFSSKFREYCDNFITPELNSAVMKLIEELVKLQDRIFLRDPIKAKMRKRHVSGIREVIKYLTLKKVKMVIIAPNLEKLQMEGGVYDKISEIKLMAVGQKVPYGFALDRYKLGRCTKKNVPVSAFAVLSYEGVEALFENVLEQLLDLKKSFCEVTKPKIEENADDVNSKVLSTLATAFQENLQINETPAIED